MGCLKPVRRACACVLAVACFSALADSLDDEFDEKPWAEVEVQLPAFPDESNLIPFRVGSRDDVKYLIDGNSLSIGVDGVVRYTVLVISASGARNVSYEGMRCAATERRLYAFGRPDKTWSKARNNRWVRIRGDSSNYIVELFSNYFCKPGGATLRDGDDLRRILRDG